MNESNVSGTVPPTYVSPFAFIVTDVLVVVFVSAASIIGNGLVLAAFIRQKRLRTSVNIFILNLALADILFGSILPFAVPNLLNDR